MVKFDMDAMVSCDILSSCEMFFIFQGLIGYKEKTLRKLIRSFRWPLDIVKKLKKVLLVIWNRWDTVLQMNWVILLQQRE